MNEITLLESCLSPKGTAKYNLTVLTEAEDKKVFSRKLAASLFDAMKKKTMSVNYMGIEKTKGDITKYPKFSDIEDSIKILDRMYQNDPSNSPKEVKVLVNALANLKKNKAGFTKAFEDKNQPAAILYVNLVAAVISGASIIISSTIDYIKDPINTYKAVFVKDSEKLYNHTYFKSLERFNTMCKNGKLKQVFDGGKKLTESTNLINENGEFNLYNESIAATISIIFLAITGVIYCLNTVPYHIYCLRHKISEDLLNLAYFVEQHAYSLDTSNEKMKAAQEKQLKIVEKLRSLGKFIGLDDEKAEKKAKEEKKKDEDDANKNSSDDPSETSYSDDDDDVLL